VLSYLFSDHLGSTTVTTDSSGTKTAEMRYKPWGETRYTSGTTPTARHYTGQYEETGIGLYFYNARWYDPVLGRFAQADTLIPQAGNPLAWDRYAYGFNNPSRYTDPTGHFTKDEIKEYFGVDTWDEVLKHFQKGGELEGCWGWLTVLEKAEIGDEIAIKWDKNQLPSGHPEVEDIYKGKFSKDKTGRLNIMGEDSYMDQMKAGKYGAEYSLFHYASDDAKRAAAAFIVIATDLLIGIPIFYFAVLSGQPLLMKAGEFLETSVVLPVNILGVKMWLDASHGKLEEVLNIQAIPDPRLPNPYQEPVR
jgi:RHS repeat-associated protein